MKTFNCDKKLITSFKVSNGADIVGLIVDVIFFIYLYSNASEFGYDGIVLWYILLWAVIICAIFSGIKLYCRFLILGNIEKEKLDITEKGLNMTFNEKVLFSDSLKYVEVPWDTVKKAEKVDHTTTKITLMDMFVYKTEYKTIHIYTTNGLFKLFIENSEEAVKIINTKTRDYCKENSSTYENPINQEAENKNTTNSIVKIHKWMCECGNMITAYPCEFCGKEEYEKVPNGYWKCKGCGELITIEQEECNCGFKRKYL